MHYLESLPPGAWAVLGTILGTIALKLIEKVVSRDRDSREERLSYRTEINELHGRLDNVEKEVTFWRARYYQEQEISAALRRRLIENGLDSSPPSPEVREP